MRTDVQACINVRAWQPIFYSFEQRKIAMMSLSHLHSLLPPPRPLLRSFLTIFLSFPMSPCRPPSTANMMWFGCCATCLFNVYSRCVTSLCCQWLIISTACIMAQTCTSSSLSVQASGVKYIHTFSSPLVWLRQQFGSVILNLSSFHVVCLPPPPAPPPPNSCLSHRRLFEFLTCEGKYLSTLNCELDYIWLSLTSHFCFTSRVWSLALFTLSDSYFILFLA